MKSMDLLLFALILLCVLLSLVPILYFFVHIGDSQFLGSLMGNWFATMIGVIVGIPIALAIDRWQRQIEEKKEREAQEQEALVRKAKILTLVKGELEYNRDVLQGRPQRIRTLDPGSRLRDETWNALSDGGELQWIGDAELLEAFSTAYHHIRTTALLEQTVFEACYLPLQLSPGGGPALVPSPIVTQYLSPVLTATYPDVLGRIDQALKEIRSRSTATEGMEGSQH